MLNTSLFPLVLRLAVGACPPESPPKPMTITYNTAARTTVIATIKMVAMTGETALLFFFHIFFICVQSPGRLPYQPYTYNYEP